MSRHEVADSVAPTRPRRKGAKHINAALLEHLLRAELAPAELAKAMGLSLGELAQWILQPGNIRTVQGLVRLADVRAQMLVSKYRANAAVNLIQIASAPSAGNGSERDQSELARRACVDLLSTNLPVFVAGDEGESELAQGSEAFGSAAPPSDEAILRAFEALAKQEPGATP